MRTLIAAILCLFLSGTLALAGTNVHILYGQGGVATSIGMNDFGNKLKALGYRVTFWNWDQYQQVAAAIKAKPNDKNAVIGYSLGGNSSAWLAQDKRVKIDLMVAYDPTVNGPPLANYPIGSNVKRAMSYQQTCFFCGTSMFFGRSVLVGPTVEVYKFQNDHLAVPLMQSLHDRTIKALSRL